MPETVRTKTHHCPRCGGSHDALAEPVAGRPPELVVPWGFAEFTHWYLCPRTGSPVLIMLGEVPVAGDGGGSSDADVPGH